MSTLNWCNYQHCPGQIDNQFIYCFWSKNTSTSAPVYAYPYQIQCYKSVNILHFRLNYCSTKFERFSSECRTFMPESFGNSCCKKFLLDLNSSILTAFLLKGLFDEGDVWIVAGKDQKLSLVYNLQLACVLTWDAAWLFLTYWLHHTLEELIHL